MKKLFTLALALVGLLSANAQSSEGWTEGQDVTAALGLGDCDGSFSGSWKANNYDGGDVSSIGDYWKGTMPNEYNSEGCIAFYNGGNAFPTLDIYQVVKVPAGVYTINVQSYYREGNPNDTFTNYRNNNPKKNAFLYASILAGQDPESEVKREFKTVIRSMASSEQYEQLYTSSLGWASDGSNTIKDAEGNNVTVWYPSCNKGTGAFFRAGKYWNSVSIILIEDAYVRMGLRKITAISEDYVPLYNFQVIYEGPADEKAQLAAAKLDCSDALVALSEFQNTVDEAGFTGFAGAITDLVMDFEEKINSVESIAEADQLLEKINETVDNYQMSMISINSLDELISMSEGMIASTDFPGLSTFKTAYDKAVADAKTDDVEALGDDPGEYFSKVYTELATARATYLDSQEKDETGAKDFTALIKHPWFVNPEFTPTHNDDGTWTLSESTWQWNNVGNPGDYSTDNGNRTDISSEVTLASDASANNQWYKRLKTFGDGWSANSYHLFYQSGLIGVSNGWCSGFDDYEGVQQQLVGLPNGYYSLKGLIRGNSTDAGHVWNDSNLPPYHNIFAENSEEVRVTSVVGHTDHYYCQQLLGSDNGWYEWNPVIWQEHKTGTIQVNDGRLLIGAQSSMIANFTGFRLMFYGVNPPFDAMIQEEIAAVDEVKKTLKCAGDKIAVDALLAEVKLPLTSAEAYDAALIKVREASEYAAFAKSADSKFNAAKTIEDLLNKYTSEEAQAILNPAFAYAAIYGEAEADTYKGYDALTAAAGKYGEYMELYEKSVSLDNEALKAELSKQVAVLKASAKGETAETLDKMMADLALPYNIAYFQEAGADKATEAAPVNITSLLVNPSFEEGPTKGWSGETPTTNDYAKGNAELWNKNPFTLSQKLTGLPAGTYELRVKAVYRDGEKVTADLVKAYNDAGGTEETWANHNAQLFAKASDTNDQSAFVKAVESLKKTEPSFTKGNFVPNEWDEETGEPVGWDWVLDIEVQGHDYGGNFVESSLEKPADPFDTRVNFEDGTTYWYPSSMYGFYSCCQKYADEVTAKVQITIEKGESLEVGIRKTANIGSDWVIMDDFELYYLSGDAFNNMLTGIEEVTAPAKSSDAIYNLSGQRVGKDYKGIIIQNGVKKLNK